MVSDAACETTSTDSSGHSVVVYIDLWVFVSLLLACVVYHFKSKVHLPTSGLLMLAGIFLRCVGVHIGMLKEAVEMLDNIEAETILLIFLPALICECAFQTDWYTFKREFAQIILLATTAVIASSYLTSVVIRFGLGYQDDFDWYAATMLGAILSATDHVAVVAQLKEVNADYRLETLIQGETLVNDGTVLVLFTAVLKGEIDSVQKDGSIVGEFFRLSCGGVALGLAFGVVLAFTLKRVINNAIVETMLTITAAYLLFFTAEVTDVHVSGALATVTLGLFISAYAKTMISPSVHESLKEFWSMLGSTFESLLMILGGMLMGHFFYDFNTLESRDIGMLFALFVLIHVVRAVIILVHWPLLRLFGYGCTFKDMLVLVFGALKGTMSVALALMAHDKVTLDIRVRHLVMFWSAGISALSSTFDALLLRFIVRALGLESMTNIEENMLVSVTTSINESTLRYIQTLKKDKELAMANWEGIVNDTGPEKLLRDALKATRNGRKLYDKGRSSPAELVQTFTHTMRITDEEISNETRRRFFTSLKRFYWRLFEEAKCFGDSSIMLIESANRGLDESINAMKDWQQMEAKIWPRRVLRYLRWAASTPFLKYIFRPILYRWMVLAYDVAQNFIRAHTDAEKLLDDMEVDIKKSVFEDVMQEAHEQVQLARTFLSDIKDAYPEVFMFVQTKQASAMILEKERKAIAEAYEYGVITEIEYIELIKSVKKKIGELTRYSLPRKPTIMEMLRTCPLFQDVDRAVIQKLASDSADSVLAKDEALFSKEEPGSGIYIVLRGRIKEESEFFSLEFSAGDAIGIQHLLPTDICVLSDLTALSTSKVVFIKVAHINELLRNEKFQRSLWFQGAKTLLVMAKHLFGELGKLDAAPMSTVFANSYVEKYRAGETVPLHCGTVLLHGAIRSRTEEMTYIPGVLGAASVATCETFALHFAEAFGGFVRDSDSDLSTAVAQFSHRGQSAPSFKISKLQPAVNAFSKMVASKIQQIPTKTTSTSFLSKLRLPTECEED